MRNPCSNCGQHPALAKPTRYHKHSRQPRYKALKNHDLCGKCFRSQMDRINQEQRNAAETESEGGLVR